MSTVLSLRMAQDQDRDALIALGAILRKPSPHDYYYNQLLHQNAGKLLILLAEREGALAGYALFNRRPKYGFYKIHNIPEIQDLNVAPDFRRLGVGTALISRCEAIACAEGFTQIGISYGLHSSFGPAQILYTKLGYRPDGQGVTYDRRIVTPGEFRPVDDQLCLMLVKDLC